MPCLCSLCRRFWYYFWCSFDRCLNGWCCWCVFVHDVFGLWYGISISPVFTCKEGYAQGLIFLLAILRATDFSVFKCCSWIMCQCLSSCSKHAQQVKVLYAVLYISGTNRLHLPWHLNSIRCYFLFINLNPVLVWEVQHSQFPFFFQHFHSTFSIIAL